MSSKISLFEQEGRVTQTNNNIHRFVERELVSEDRDRGRFSKLRGRSSILPLTTSVAQESAARPRNGDCSSVGEPITPWLQELLSELSNEVSEIQKDGRKEDKLQTSVGTDTFADEHGDVNEMNSRWFSMLLKEVRKSLAEEMQSWGQQHNVTEDEPKAEDETVRVFCNECTTGRIEGLRKAARKRNQQRKSSSAYSSIRGGVAMHSHIFDTQRKISSNLTPNQILSTKFPNAAAKLFEFAPATAKNDISMITRKQRNSALKPQPHQSSSHSSQNQENNMSYLQDLLLKRRSRIARKDALKRELGSERRVTNLLLQSTRLREDNHWKFIRGLLAMEGKKRENRIGANAEDFDDIVNSDENQDAQTFVPRPRMASESSKNYSNISTSGGEDYEEEDAMFLSPIPSHASSKRKTKSVHDSQYDGDSSSPAADTTATRQPSSLLVYPSPLIPTRPSEDLTLMPVWVNEKGGNEGKLLSSDDNKQSLQEFIQHSGEFAAGVGKEGDEEGMCVIDMSSPLSENGGEGQWRIRHENTLPPSEADWNEVTSNDFDFDEEHIRSKIRNHDDDGDESFDEDAEAEKIYQAQLQHLRVVQQKRIEAEEAEAELKLSQRANSRVSEPQQDKYRAINQEIKAAVQRLNQVPRTTTQNAMVDDSDYNKSGMIADDEDTDCVYRYFLHKERDEDYGDLEEIADTYDDSSANEDWENQNVVENEYYHSNPAESIHRDDGMESDSNSDLPDGSNTNENNFDVQVGDFDLKEGTPGVRVYDSYMIDPNQQEHIPKLPRTPPATETIDSGNSSTDLVDEIQRMNHLNAIVEKRLKNNSPQKEYSGSGPILVPSLECLIVGEDGSLRTSDARLGETDTYSYASKILRNKTHHHRDLSGNDPHVKNPAESLATSEPLFIVRSEDSVASAEILTPDELKEMLNEEENERNMALPIIKSAQSVTGRTVKSRSNVQDAKLPMDIPQKEMKSQSEICSKPSPITGTGLRNLNNHHTAPPVPHPTNVVSRQFQQSERNARPFATPQKEALTNKGVIVVPLCNFHPSVETADWLLIGTNHFPSAFASMMEAEPFDQNEGETIDLLVVDPFEALHHRRNTLTAQRDSQRQELAVERGRELIAEKKRKLRNIHLAKACTHRFSKELKAMAVMEQYGGNDLDLSKQEQTKADNEDVIHYKNTAKIDKSTKEPSPNYINLQKHQVDSVSGEEVDRPASWLSRAIAVVTAVTHAFKHSDEKQKENHGEKTGSSDTSKELKRAGISIDVLPEKSDEASQFSAATIGKHFSHTRARLLAQRQQWEVASRLPPIKQSLSAIIDGESKAPEQEVMRVEGHESYIEANGEEAKEIKSFDFLFGGESSVDATHFTGAPAYSKALRNTVQEFRSRVVVPTDSDRLLIADHLRHAYLRDRARSIRIVEDNTFKQIAYSNKDSLLDHKIDHEVYLLELKMANYRREQFLEKRKELLKNDQYRQIKVGDARKKAKVKHELQHEEHNRQMQRATARRQAFIKSRVDRLAAQEVIRKERTEAGFSNRNIMSTDSE